MRSTELAPLTPPKCPLHEAIEAAIADGLAPDAPTNAVLVAMGTSRPSWQINQSGDDEKGTSDQTRYVGDGCKTAAPLPP